MNKLINLTILFFIYVSVLSAQCPSGDVVMFDQEDIDNFLIDYPNCTEIEGSLRIGSNDPGGDQITSLSSLQNINSVLGTIQLDYNSMLTSLDGFQNLTTIGQDFFLESNIALTNLNELSNVESIGGSFSVASHDLLTNLDGLSNVLFIGENIDILNNAALANVDGLSNVSSNISGHIGIEDNAVLTNVDGLSGIPSVGASMRISDNPLLENLTGLSGFTSFGVYLQIFNNASLTTCSMNSICDFLTDTADSELGEFNAVGNNAPGCNSQTEVFNGCNDVVRTNDISQFHITIAPNPFINQLFLTKTTNQIFDYQLLDMTGRILSTGNLEQQNNTLVFTKINAGIYFLKIVDTETNSFAVEKIVKI